MGNEFRVYNHTDRELIVETEGKKQYRLLGQCVSPKNARPEFLWAADGSPISNRRVWKLTPGFDVHVNELGSDNSLGADSGALVGASRVTDKLRISGLGIEPTEDKPHTYAGTPGAWFYRDDELWVTVLGAGITGLSAAHELVTRGFRVQVIERAHGSPADAPDLEPDVSRFKRGLTAPDIGGIARTQWVTRPLERAGLGTVFTERAEELPFVPPAALHSVHGDALWFGTEGGPVERGTYHAFGITWDGDRMVDPSKAIIAWLDEVSLAGGRSVAACQLVVIVYQDPPTKEPQQVHRAYARLEEFLKLLVPDRPLTNKLGLLEVLPTARIDVPAPDPGKKRVGLMIRLHEDLGLIAGEHGFRFFPGFYRHLRDTMRRTPIYDPVTRTFTERTAADNLEEVDWQVIADPARTQIAPFWRKPFTTLGALVDQYRALRRDTGYRPIDLLRFWLRIVRYMTSSTARRKAYYEDMDWWTFLSKPHLDDPGEETPIPYGARFGEALRHSTKALVAMGAEFADARTQGNISIQLLMDQFGLHDQSDSTLVGPTSTSWLRHWRTYLEQQGVQFFVGEVTSIETQQRKHSKYPRAKIVVEFAENPGAQPATYLDGEAKLETGAIKAHYIVSALDLPSLARVTRKLRTADPHSSLACIGRLVCDANGQERDLEDITKLGLPMLDGDKTGISDRWQTLTGMQLYYKRHVSFASGHIYFASSPWGLSAISQIQYWGPFGSGHRGRLLGNLSIDIGSWRSGSDGKYTTLDPNAMDRDEIAIEVQRQIDRCTNHGELRSLRQAEFYHLDDYIGFAGDATKIHPVRNHAPFMINVVGDWESRPPGEPWSPNDLSSRGRLPGRGKRQGTAWTPSEGGYPVHYDNLVVAGTHLRTFTRMGTMETANESARHAVNTILDHATLHYPPPSRGLMTERIQPMASLNVDKHTTYYGDYCDIWNPEDCEFQDLEFLRLVDQHLMEAADRPQDDVPPDHQRKYVPHLFDILKIDELPELIDDDDEAVGVLEIVGSAMKAFDDARIDDLPSVFAVIDRVRKQIAKVYEHRRR